MIAAVKRLVSPSPMQAVDDELGRVRSQLAALAEAEAACHEKGDALAVSLRAGIEAGQATDEIEAAILSERATLEGLALRRVPLERLAVEKAAALRVRKHRLRVESLEEAGTSVRADLVKLDGEIVEAVLVVSEELSRRATLERDILAIAGRLARIGERPEPTGGLALDEEAISKAFREKFPQASRAMPFGERAAATYELGIPVVTPERTTAAVVADDEMAASE
jgi:hypothetical protein